ncbi:MAG: hypothetical protein AAGA92_06625 [Planctomycetota bacterium]
MRGSIAAAAITLILPPWSAVCGPALAGPGSPAPDFAAAADRYEAIDAQWFHASQEALRDEVERVAGLLDDSEAADWKAHLRWGLLEEAARAPLPGRLDDLALVRRWMYSNKPGLESERFADLRRLVDEHLDAVTAFSEADLQSAVRQNAATAAGLSKMLEESPSETTAAELGRLLGWFDRVRQLPEETAAARLRYSRPNIELLVSNGLIQRIFSHQTGELTETIPLRQKTKAPATRRLQRERTLDVSGNATTTGAVSLNITPSDGRAAFEIVYQGTLDAECRADAGPVVLHLRARGNATAAAPVYFGLDGLSSGEIDVQPVVSSRLTGVTGKSRFLREVARRRASHPTSQATQNREARSTAVEQLGKQLEEQVAFQLDKIRREANQLRSSVSGLSDVTAPLVREGAMPRFDSTRSTDRHMVLGVAARNRDQLGAVAPPPPETAADLTARFHVSAFNNMAETITGGKRLSDEFFMRYAKLLHAELPIPLMVHSRAGRWAVWPTKLRPFELRIPGDDRFDFVIRLDRVEIDEQFYDGPVELTASYALQADDDGEVGLIRQGDLQIETELPTGPRLLVLEKLGAFFGPTLTGGGVIVPRGGPLGLFQNLRLERHTARDEWIVLEMNVPDSVLAEFNHWRAERGLE